MIVIICFVDFALGLAAPQERPGRGRDHRPEHNPAGLQHDPHHFSPCEEMSERVWYLGEAASRAGVSNQALLHVFSSNVQYLSMQMGATSC